MANTVEVASAEIGVREVKGSQSNPQIIRYAEETGFSNYKSDESAWCSLFANWVAHKAGLERSNSLAARSWLNVGIPIENPEPGDVVVFWRESRDSWKGHVGFFHGFSSDKSRVYCLGGNQGNQVSVTAKPIGRVLGYRRLRPDGPTTFSRKTLKRGSTGRDVVKLQDALKQLGYNCGTSDGIFGRKTEQCLKDFQATNPGLNINGIFDKKSRDFMVEMLTAQMN
ncbi:TIGR02594 family protein [Robiginitalea myxolifaciens]|uniref:TIGR02594 family protein n=1 Tax=Robiginitalea myxolifaciens TaxID=400055 RepID=A0A1I6HFZ4_9FLAO|nr:TIGR02594 family protein [Robiginitalea myxolifaciens]SFR53197.1 TIGR02594 family protein [Robiginitalea myxolifaciens]